MYRHYSWEHSYFSGKTRAYLRHKSRMGALGPGFEDVLATPELLSGLLIPKSGTSAIPQLEAPDGTWIQDTSDIIDFCEAAHPEHPVVPDAATSPRQTLASYLIELLADEWLIVPGFWERWFFSEDGRDPSHRAFNEQQWGAVIAPGAPGEARRAAGATFFENAFGISTSRTDPKGVYRGLVDLGCTAETEHAWQDSLHNVSAILEAHFAQHDYVLGGRPSLGDYGLLGPYYAHVYRDAVAGFALRTHFPIVTEWVERANGESAVNSRLYGTQLYSLSESGELVGRPATSDGGEWVADDAIPDTLAPLLGVFFEEMWPVLDRSIELVTAFIESDAHERGGELPGKSFTASPGFGQLQTGDGPLSHAFEIRGVTGRRMVVPLQVWMLNRVASVVDDCVATETGRKSIESMLDGFPNGRALLDLSERLAACPIEKRGGQLFSVAR